MSQTTIFALLPLVKLTLTVSPLLMISHPEFAYDSSVWSKINITKTRCQASVKWPVAN